MLLNDLTKKIKKLNGNIIDVLESEELFQKCKNDPNASSSMHYFNMMGPKIKIEIELSELSLFFAKMDEYKDTFEKLREIYIQKFHNTKQD